MKPIEQALVEYFDDIEAVLDFRFYATNDVAEILADVFYALVDNVDWLAVANAVAAKNEPVFNGEEISLSDSFVGYNGEPESIEPVVFNIYDTVIDDNTPIEVIERILESGELALRYDYFIDENGDENNGNLLVREGDKYVIYFIYEDGSLHRYRRCETLAEAWHFMSISHGPIKVVDVDRIDANAPLSAVERLLADESKALRYEYGSLSAGRLMYVRDGKYHVFAISESGALLPLRIDGLEDAWGWFCQLIGDRDINIVDAPEPAFPDKLDRNAPLSLVRSILEAGKVIGHPAIGYCDSCAIRAVDGQYQGIIDASRDLPVVFYDRSAWEIWDWLRGDVDEFFVRDSALEIAQMPHIVRVDTPFGDEAPTDSEAIRALLDSGEWAIHYDVRDNWCGKTLLMRNGEYVVTYEYADGAILIDHSVHFASAWRSYAVVAKDSYIVPIAIDELGDYDNYDDGADDEDDDDYWD